MTATDPATHHRPEAAPPRPPELPRVPAGDDPARRIPRRNLVAVAIVGVVCLVGAALAVRSASDPRQSVETGGPSLTTGAAPDDLAAVRNRPHLTFRSTALGPSYGSVAVAALDPDSPGATGTDTDTDEPPATVTGLQCERVAAGADRAICLIADRGAITTYRAVITDDHDQQLFTTELPGSPSRARVSRDGRFGSVTAFVTGHGYAEVGFSTFTEILDLRTGESFGDLEQFTLWRDGTLVDAADRNFWGVTFAEDPTTFYATVGTGGATYLVRGDLTTRQLTTVRPDVECPSLSPDGTRIAFKQRVTGALGRVEWRLAVLDLATMTTWTTAETRSVDDQAEWLDDDTLLYGLAELEEGSPATDVWAVPADGSGAPVRYRRGAWSPTVDRDGAGAG